VGVSAATGGIVALAASHRLMSMGLDSGSWQEHHGRERRGGRGGWRGGGMWITWNAGSGRRLRGKMHDAETTTRNVGPHPTVPTLPPPTHPKACGTTPGWGTTHHTQRCRSSQ
jgi:hypothetical protein